MSEPTYSCEQCGDRVSESDAYTEDHPGARGNTVTIAFCPKCTQREF